MVSKSLRTLNLFKGAFYLVCCYLCLALFYACAKLATESVSVFTVLFFQNSICFFLNLPRSYRIGLKTELPYIHLVRDLFGFASYFLFVVSVMYIPLTSSVLLANSAPLWVPFIIWIWFKKKVPSYLWSALVLGFIGVFFILKPGKEIFDFAAVLALFSGIFNGVTMVAIRKLTRTEPTPRILFYYFLFGSIVSFPFVVNDFSHAIHFPVLYYLVGGALLTYLVQIFLTKGFSYGKASTLSPLAYAVVLFSAILDRIFWHKVPDSWSLFGMALVIIGGIVSIYLEKKYEGKYI